MSHRASKASPRKSAITWYARAPSPSGWTTMPTWCRWEHDRSSGTRRSRFSVTTGMRRPKLRDEALAMTNTDTPATDGFADNSRGLDEHELRALSAHASEQTFQ